LERYKNLYTRLMGWLQSRLPRFCSCGRYDSRVLSLLSLSSLPDHFTCADCRRVISPDETFFTNASGRPVCGPCGARAAAASSTGSSVGQSSLGTCTTCFQPIRGEMIAALGGEYHTKCFRCMRCKKVRMQHLDRWL